MSVQTSIIRRRLGIRAAFQVLTCHEDPQAAEYSIYSQMYDSTAQLSVLIGCLFSIRQHVCVEAVLKVMTQVKMKDYYRAAISTVRYQHARTHTNTQTSVSTISKNSELTLCHIKNPHS